MPFFLELILRAFVLAWTFEVQRRAWTCGEQGEGENL